MDIKKIFLVRDKDQKRFVVVSFGKIAIYDASDYAEAFGVLLGILKAWLMCEEVTDVNEGINKASELLKEKTKT